MADFQFYLNRQGAKGEKGDKGDKGNPGNTPIPSTGTNTSTEYTIVWDLGDGNTWETGNLKQPTVDQGGTTLRYDRANDRIVLEEPDLASTANMTPGIVYLADDERIENEDVQDDDAVTYKVFKDKTDDLQERITEVGDDLDNLADVVDRNSDDIESLDGRLDDEEANMLIVQGDITTLNDTKASKTELSSGLATKANVVHNHTMSQITDAGSLAKKNNVNYQTEVINKPTISNNTITIKQGTTIKGTFTLNQTNDGLITLDDPTGVTPGPGLDLDTFTNTLSVKLDNNTLGINSDGEIEVQNAGTTYSEGNAIDLTNDAISVKYDNNTLKLNGSGQLYADIPAANDATITITQGGITKGTFTTNQSVNGTIALDAGPDMSAYYTKTQTDSLLDEKIDNNIVQYPLQYLPDTTNVINSLNDTNLTINRVNGDNNGEYSSSNTIRFYDSTDLSITDFTTDPKGLINKTTLGWIEYEFGDNFNLVLTGGLVDNSGYSRFSFMYPAFLGYYENNEFIPVIVLSLDQPGYYNYARLKTIVNNTIVQNITTANQDYVASYMAIQFQSGVLKFRCVSDYGFMYNSRTTVTLSQSEAEEIAKCTHLRVVPITKGSYTSNAYLSPYNAYYNKYYEIYNPSIDVINTEYPKNGQTSIFANIHPASLSLKYDNNTLSVNSSNELTVPTATTSNLGLVKPDGTTITIDGNGVISSAGGSNITIDEANLSTEDFVEEGSPTITRNNGDVIVTSSSWDDYVRSANNIDINSNVFEVKTAIKPTINLSSSDNILAQRESTDVYGWSIYQTTTGLGFWMNKDGNNVFNYTFTYSFMPNTKYYIKLTGNGSEIGMYVKSENDSDYTKIGYIGTNANLSFTNGPTPIRTCYLSGQQYINDTSVSKNGTMIYQGVIPFNDTLTKASTSQFGLVKIDGTSITVDSNGVISAASSTPSNMVTTDTNQTITGQKTFDTDCLKTKNILFNESGYSYGLRIDSGTLKYGQSSGEYSYLQTNGMGVEGSIVRHQLYENGLWSGSGINNAYTQRIGLSGYGYSYLANNQGRKFYNPAYSSATSSFTPDASTPFFITSDLLDGTTIQYNSTSGKVEADLSSYYTKSEVDALLATLTSQITALQANINGGNA